MPPLILASRSPQRRAILEQLNIAFEVLVVDVEELAAGDPVEVARANALRQGATRRRAATRAHDPRRRHRRRARRRDLRQAGLARRTARATLKRLSGRTHEVVSGLALLKPGNPQVVHEVTNVTFRALDDDLIRRYVNTGEWSGRAGGYAIQGQGAGLVRRIMGDYLNVVGLPVGKLLDLDLTLMLREN